MIRNTINNFFNLDEENSLIDDINKISLSASINNCNCTDETNISNLDNYLHLLNTKKIELETKCKLIVKEIIKIKNKNTKMLDNLLAVKSIKNKKIEMLYKEFSFITTITKLRIVNLEEFLERKDSNLIGYLLNIELNKLILIEIEESANSFESAQFFWDSMSNLFNINK